MVRKFAVLTLLLALPLLIAAGGNFPSSGIVTGDRVNLRAGPSTNDPSLGFASKGDHLTVLASKAGWYQVKCPRKVSLWIHSKFITASGQVKGNGVNLRPRPNTTHAPVGRVGKGEQLKVISTKTKDWVKVVPPSSATAWISSRYVRTTGGSLSKDTIRTDPVGRGKILRPTTPRVATDPTLDVAERYLRLEMLKEPEDMTLDPVIGLFRQVLESNASEDVKERARQGLQQAEKWKRISDVMIEVNRPVPELGPRNPYPRPRLRSENEDDYLAIGWVEGRGKILFGGASHRLQMGKETQMLMKSSDFRLNDFVGKRVGIRGTTIGWEGSRKVVLVEDIHVFGK
ncbi:MAG: SH3 domain-containing protein [Planctomycetota bacterium]|nr:SH3 domain-containing protein [Planctomycetota bacterium]